MLSSSRVHQVSCRGEIWTHEIPFESTVGNAKRYRPVQINMAFTSVFRLPLLASLPIPALVTCLIPIITDLGKVQKESTRVNTTCLHANHTHERFDSVTTAIANVNLLEHIPSRLVRIPIALDPRAYLARPRSHGTMATEFPPPKVKAIVEEVTTLLKERKETVSVAETVGVVPPEDLWAG